MCSFTILCMKFLNNRRNLEEDVYVEKMYLYGCGVMPKLQVPRDHQGANFDAKKSKGLYYELVSKVSQILIVVQWVRVRAPIVGVQGFYCDYNKPGLFQSK